MTPAFRPAGRWARIGKFTTIALTAMLVLSTCDCMRVVSAVVLDAGTGEPMEGASIRERHDNGTYEAHQDLTNAEGVFHFSDISGGLGGCPPVQLHISKEGYVPFDRVFDTGSRGDTVRLARERAF